MTRARPMAARLIKSGTNKKTKYLKPKKPTNEQTKNLAHIRP